jgi:hypothetical protein
MQFRQIEVVKSRPAMRTTVIIKIAVLLLKCAGSASA